MTGLFQEKDYIESHEVFARSHNQLRQELLDALPARPQVPAVSPLRRPVFKWSAAAAALLVVALAVWSILGAPQARQIVNPGTAWASAIEQAAHMRNVHLRFTTPRPDQTGTGVELWWQSPHNFRMTFDTGLVMTGNQEMRCTFDPQKVTLTINDPAETGLEMFVLGELGQMFTSEYAMSKLWLQEAVPVTTEDILYKGELCSRITLEKNARRYEYIIDKTTAVIYEGTCYSDTESRRVLSRMTVLDITEMPDNMFAILPSQGVTVIDQRSE